MSNQNTKSVASASLIQRLILAAAPGGVLTRKYVFLGLGAGLVIIIAGIGFMSHLRGRADDPAGVRLSDREITQFPTRSYIATSASLGRGEVRQYGLLDDKHMDATVIMMIPPPGQMGGRDFSQEVRELDAVRNATRATIAGSYELQTRFGLYQATELQVDMVGRWKDCLAFVSRFDTSAVYVKGWYCNTIGEKPNPERLACALDGLTVDGRLATADADTFMHGRIARPSFCAAISTGRDREPRPLPPATTPRMR
jgi:hypothetical protein